MREGWEYKKLGEVCDKVTNIRWKDIPSDVCYPYIDLSSVDRDSLSIVETIEVSKDDAPSRAKQIVHTNDILFGTTRPTLKRVCLVNEDNDENICSTGFCVLRAIEEYSLPKWLFYQLLSGRFYSYIEPLQSGANYPAVSDGIVKSYSIPIPPLSEQQRIVEELDLLSSIIEKKKAQLKELDSLAQSIFYDMFGDPVENEKGWEVKKLGEEFEVSSGGTPSTSKSEYWDNGNISWIGSNMCQNQVLHKNDGKFITKEGLEHSSAKLYLKGYVLVALVGATIGKVALLDFDTTTNQNIAGINVPNKKDYTSFFIFYLIQSLYFLFENIGEGKFKMANLSFIRALPIISPPLPLQQQFAEKIEAIEHQKELIKQSIKEVETLFNSRMDYYLDG